MLIYFNYYEFYNWYFWWNRPIVLSLMRRSWPCCTGSTMRGLSSWRGGSFRKDARFFWKYWDILLSKIRIWITSDIPFICLLLKLRSLGRTKWLLWVFIGKLYKFWRKKWINLWKDNQMPGSNNRDLKRSLLCFSKWFSSGKRWTLEINWFIYWKRPSR